MFEAALVLQRRNKNSMVNPALDAQSGELFNVDFMKQDVRVMCSEDLEG